MTAQGTYLLQGVAGRGCITLCTVDTELMGRYVFITFDATKKTNKIPYPAETAIVHWDLKSEDGTHWTISIDFNGQTYFLCQGGNVRVVTDPSSDAAKWLFEPAGQYKAIRNKLSGACLSGPGPYNASLELSNHSTNKPTLQWNFVRVEKSGRNVDAIEGELLDLIALGGDDEASPVDSSRWNEVTILD